MCLFPGNSDDSGEVCIDDLKMKMIDEVNFKGLKSDGILGLGPRSYEDHNDLWIDRLYDAGIID